ncbi:Uncharacterised protein [Klebsiella oxytoca]|nr:Uncharacterised protein [Klebsiella oxytoca]
MFTRRMSLGISFFFIIPARVTHTIRIDGTRILKIAQRCSCLKLGQILFNCVAKETSRGVGQFPALLW